MILFELQCAHDHRFEAWFRNGDTYDEQAARGLIACPVCGDKVIRKAPMAPSVVKARSSRASETSRAFEERKPSTDAVSRAAPGPEEIREALKALRNHVREHFDYVGDRFSEEARKIHYGEIEERPIYGEADHEQAKELEDEGIPFAILPILPRDN